MRVVTTGPTGIADPCPVCNAVGSRVTDSRPFISSPGWRRRRRKCDACLYVWSTLEVPAEFVGKFRLVLRQIDDARGALDRLEALLRGAGMAAVEDDDDAADPAL